MARLMLILALAGLLVGCGDDDEEGGSIKITNATSAELASVRWNVFYLSSYNLAAGSTGRVELGAGLDVWGEPHQIQFSLGGTEYGTAETYAVERGETREVVLDDSTQLIECLLDTDPACIPAGP